MRIGDRGFHPAFVRWIPFFIGFLIGVLFVIVFGRQFITKQELWGIGSFSNIRYLSVKKESLFLYVLEIRWRVVLLMIFLAVTMLGRLVRIICTAWYGFCFGTMLMAASMVYHMKGILLVLSGLFPQMLLYVPAYILLCSISRQLYECTSEHRTDISVKELGSRLLVLIALVMAGCLLESYVNPVLMTKLLKKF